MADSFGNSFCSVTVVDSGVYFGCDIHQAVRFLRRQ
jgi:hypothetical protein